MKIEWIGEDREVPGYPPFTIGDTQDIPNTIAASLIDQGLAKVHKAKPKAEAPEIKEEK